MALPNPHGRCCHHGGCRSLRIYGKLNGNECIYRLRPATLIFLGGRSNVYGRPPLSVRADDTNHRQYQKRADIYRQLKYPESIDILIIVYTHNPLHVIIVRRQ